MKQKELDLWYFLLWWIAFSDVQLILDDFINEMDLSEVLSLGALIAAYTRQGHDINIALSAIGLYWKLADYTLISARGKYYNCVDMSIIKLVIIIIINLFTVRIME